jgi:UTP--glucose-1-phosphate uridylyltransferase
MTNVIKKLNKAIIPVAGLGSRMLPATKAIPKELLPIYDRPIIEHVVKEAISAGITEIILVTRSGKEAIENHFDMNYELENRLEKKGKENILKTIKNIIPKEIKISSIRQNDALGLGHAILCAKHLIHDEPFAILLPDVLVVDDESNIQNYSFSSMKKAWDQSGVGQIMVEYVENEFVENYGIVDMNGYKPEPFSSVGIKRLVEKPAFESSPSNFAILGRYILPANVMEFLENTQMGVGGEIQLTDALDKFLKENKLNSFFSTAKIFDCGNKKGFIGANLALGLRDAETSAYIKSMFDTLTRNV